MKKRYDKLSMSPLGFVPENGVLLDASIVAKDSTVTSMGQELGDPVDFTNSDTFNTEWE